MSDNREKKKTENSNYVPSTLAIQFLTSLWVIFVSIYVSISPIMKVNIDGGLAFFCLIPFASILSIIGITWYITEKTRIRSFMAVAGLTILAVTVLMIICYGALFLYDIWI